MKIMVFPHLHTPPSPTKGIPPTYIGTRKHTLHYKSKSHMKEVLGKKIYNSSLHMHCVRNAYARRVESVCKAYAMRIHEYL